MFNFELEKCGFHEGFCIYVECGEEYSDAELMKHLGISGYKKLPPEDSPERPTHHDPCVQFASDGRWVHISDDLGWTLFNEEYYGSEQLRKQIVKFARLHNIFVRMPGDADDSFEFEYHEGSKLRRRYVFRDDMWNPENGNVIIDFGETLPGEKELSGEVDMFEKIKGIEDALGIETDVEKLSIRTYYKPPPSFLDRLLFR
jgi:hypothetical protein